MYITICYNQQNKPYYIYNCYKLLKTKTSGFMHHWFKQSTRYMSWIRSPYTTELFLYLAMAVVTILWVFIEVETKVRCEQLCPGNKILQIAAKVWFCVQLNCTRDRSQYNHSPSTHFALASYRPRHRALIKVQMMHSMGWKQSEHQEGMCTWYWLLCFSYSI